MVKFVSPIQDRGGNEPYSDTNAPGSFEMTLAAAPASPPAGEAVLWTVDGKALLMKAPDGTVTQIGPSAGGGGGSSLWTDLLVAADVAYGASSTAGQLFSTALTFNMAANTTYEFEGMCYWTVAATTTGFRFGMQSPSAVAAGTLWMEYPSAAAATTTFIQSHGAAALAPSMAVTTASLYAAPQINMIRMRGIVANGATAQAMTIQIASELANTAITLKRGSRLSYRAA